MQIEEGLTSIDTDLLHVTPVQPQYSIIFRTYDGSDMLDTLEKKGGSLELRSVTFTYVTINNIREVTKIIFMLNRKLKILKMNIELDGISNTMKGNLIKAILSCTSLQYIGIANPTIMIEVLRELRKQEPPPMKGLSISCEVNDDIIGNEIINSPLVKFLEIVPPQDKTGKIFLRNIAGSSIHGLTIDPSMLTDTREAADVFTTFPIMNHLRVRTADHIIARKLFDSMSEKKLTVLNIAIGCAATHAVAGGLKELRPKSVCFERPCDPMTIASVISAGCGPATTSLSFALICEDDVACSRLAASLTRYRLRHLRITFTSSTVRSIITMITHIKGCTSLERFEIGKFGVGLVEDSVIAILNTIYKTFESSTISCIELVSRKGWDGADDYNGVDKKMLSTISRCIVKSKLAKITSKGINVEVFGKYYRKYL